jgi:hypothetical protein
MVHYFSLPFFQITLNWKKISQLSFCYKLIDAGCSTDQFISQFFISMKNGVAFV